MSKKPESPITLVVRRGALRRFHKLQKETANLPVVVTWDRRTDERQESTEPSRERPEEERRQQPSFTWELADFIVIPGEAAADESGPTASKDELDDATKADETEDGKAARRR